MKTTEPHWRSIDPTTVVCAAGGCNAPAVRDVDAQGRPASDPWGWRCAAHPRFDNQGINLVLAKIADWQAGRCTANDVADFTVSLVSGNPERARRMTADAMRRYLHTRQPGDASTPLCCIDTQENR